MKRRSLIAIFLTGMSFGAVCQQGGGRRLSSYVNPFIGASTSVAKGGNFAGLGKTFPGAATPFGLVQVSPNTITGGDNGSGYSYEHTSIEGFACTQMSGVGWYGDLGNFLVMPTSGELKVVAGTEGQEGEGYRSNYDKTSEKASAGYYAVKLTKYNVFAELTAAPHSGMMRFTFPPGSGSRIQIDLARRVGGTSTLQQVQVVDDHTIRGWMKCTPAGGGWGHGDGKADYTVYFYAQFSKSLKKYGVWSGDTVLSGVRMKEGAHLGFYTEFATTGGEKVLLKTGISFVSMEGAEKNLKAEIGDWNFDKVHEGARTLWDKALGKMGVEGGTDDEKTIFYTSLYHTLIDPRVLSDIDGAYPGGDGKVHRADEFTKHTIFSGWDVFRSQMPLQTIINPQVVNDLIASLVELADQSGKGYLERWELLNAYSGCMVGNPAVVVLADAYARGIRNYDVARAYQYAVNTCEKFGNKDGWDPNISITLENGFAEWCLSQLAGALGKEDDRKKYAARGESFKNIFNDSVHWFRPRRSDGSWEPWPAEGRLKQDYGTVESNPYQQGWFVPQDIPGMVKLMGGREAVIADLQQFFAKTPENMLWNNYYNHANEPVHHVPFLFNRLGVPWLTQEWTRKICQRAYHNSVEGLVGNEDVGQMSAWYVLAASGLHPVCPGDNRWEITSPVFDKVEMQLDPRYSKGKSFTIVARHNSPENVYIQGATLNGTAYDKCWLDHTAIQAGGVLTLEMGPAPNSKWGKETIVDTVMTYSPSMHKEIRAVVVKPSDYGQGGVYPVVYLLHGYSGNYGDWINKVAAIKEYADRWKLLIVCPDGNFSSWYFDSPVDSSLRYETYVGSELVNWVDTRYRTVRGRKGRAITGLSMGGHGALYLAFRHQDVFGAAGSMSGGVDIRPFPKNWDIARRLGTYDSFPQRWADYSVVNQTGLLKPGSLSLIFDCGSDDFFYKVNTELHEKLLAAKIPHDFISRPGAHTWNYWGSSVEYQLLFFHHFFEHL
jgi:predicted alpha-1,2-mannosidase